MVKTPKMRHSKPRRDPVTIDLEATRVPGDQTTAETAPGEEMPASAINPDAPEAWADLSPAKEAEPATDKPAAEAAVATETKSSADKPGETAASGWPQPEVETVAEAPKSSTFDRPKAATPPPPRPAPPQRSGLSTVAAGLIGGVMALLGAGALQFGGLLPSPGTGSGDAAALETVRTQVTALQSEIETLKSAPGGAPSEAMAALQAKVDGFANDLAGLRQAVESGGAGENAGLAALDAKVTEVQSKLAELAQNGGELGPVNEKLSSLEAAILEATGGLASSDGRLTSLEQQLSQLTSKVDGQANQPKIALSIAASALKAAIDRGQSFTAELETLAAISPNLPQLATLRSHAEAGVATRDDLLAETDAAASAMIAAGDPVDPNAGVIDQLWQSAASLVTVRPVGAVAGEGVPETTARIEVALKAGDLTKALAEYETLPEAAKAAGSGFAARIKARLDVETLVDQAIAEAMKTV